METGRVTVTVEIRASLHRVWEALVDPAQVTQWDGAVPVKVPEGYPCPGQRARWRVRVWGVPLILHDEVRDVLPLRCLRTRLRYAFTRIEEEYRLEESFAGTVFLTSDNFLQAWGFSFLPVFLVSWQHKRATCRVMRDVQSAMTALVYHCENEPSKNE